MRRGIARKRSIGLEWHPRLHGAAGERNVAAGHQALRGERPERPTCRENVLRGIFISAIIMAL